MAGIRRAPKAKGKPVKRKAPIHQRILGRSQVEIDLLDDLDSELEKAYELDQIEYDDYLDCKQALELRREKANIGRLKAIGAYVKPETKIDVPVKVVRQSKIHLDKVWVKIVVVVLMFLALKCCM